MQMSEIVILAKVELTFALASSLRSRKFILNCMQYLTNYKTTTKQTCKHLVCVCLILPALLLKIHQVCNGKLPLSPQRADSEGGVNAQDSYCRIIPICYELVL